MANEANGEKKEKRGDQKEKRYSSTFPRWVEDLLEAYIADKHCNDAQGVRDWIIAFAEEHYGSYKPDSIAAMKRDELSAA